jgi:hypothetical protein
MAISFVGSTTGLVAATDTTVNFSSLLDSSGSTPTVAQNDIVIVTLSRRSAGAASPALTTTGYAAIYASVFADSTDDTNLISFYKIMGATPDTSVVITTTGTTNIQSYCVHVLRGVDTTTPFDGITPTTSTGVGAGSPDAPAITPATAGAWIMACGGAAGPNTAGQTTVLTNPANLDSTTNFFRSTAGTRTATGAGIFSGWTSGAFDPVAFGGGAQNASGSFAAATFALRPAASGGRTGTLAATESGSDTFAGSVAIRVTASLAGVETGSDTFAANGAVKVSGSLSATETATDTFAGLSIAPTFAPVTPIGWIQKLKSGSWAAATYISGSTWTQKQQGRGTW